MQVPVNPDDIFNGAEMPLESTRAGSSAFTVVNGPPVIKAEQIPPYTETKSFLHVRLAWQVSPPKAVDSCVCTSIAFFPFSVWTAL